MSLFWGVFIVYIVLAFVISAGAKNRNRSGFGFFILTLLLSPLISFIILIALGEKKTNTSMSNNETNSENNKYTSGKKMYPNAAKKEKICPNCEKNNPAMAISCNGCGKSL